MVPFAVYNIQRTLNMWPKDDPGKFVEFNQWIRPGWIVMEIATIIIGLAFVGLWGIHFPFLLFPVSFVLWYLSMDLAPLIPGWQQLGHFTVRARVSIVMGALMIVLGYVFENRFGSDPDMGFWLYLFGLLTFLVAINFDFPVTDVHGSIFLLIQMGIILLGSHLDRTTFHVFGTIGVVVYVLSIYTTRIMTSNSVLLWLMKAMVAAALFSQALRRDGNIEILAGAVCLLGFNFNFINFATSSEVYSLLLLFTNLGFVAISEKFSRPLDLWLFTIPNMAFIISFFTSISVIVYYFKIVEKHFGKPVIGMSSHLYLLYRFFSSVAISFVFVFLRQSHFAWVGGLGLTAVALCFQPLVPTWTLARNYNNENLGPNTVRIVMLLLSVFFALFLQSNLLYLVSCLALLFSTLSLLSLDKIQGCVFAVFLILFSIPLNSKFLIVIGTIYIITYLTHLAYVTFKDSLTFPLVLIVLGMLIIFSAVKYQAVEAEIQDLFYASTPALLRGFLSMNIQSFWREGSSTDWYLLLSETRFTVKSAITYPFNWLLWPGALTHALVNGRFLFMAYLCAASVVILVAVAIVIHYRNKMVKHLDGLVKVCLE